MVAKASAFRHFVETEYKLSQWAAKQQDRARRRPLVTAAAIFRAVACTVYAQGGMPWEELVFPLKLAWVRETRP